MYIMLATFSTSLDFMKKKVQNALNVTRGNGDNLKNTRFPENVRKQFFTVRVTEHWHRLPKDIVECPTLKILRGSLDIVLGSNSLWMSLSDQGIGGDDHLTVLRMCDSTFS